MRIWLMTWLGLLWNHSTLYYFWKKNLPRGEAHIREGHNIKHAEHSGINLALLFPPLSASLFERQRRVLISSKLCVARKFYQSNNTGANSWKQEAENLVDLRDCFNMIRIYEIFGCNSIDIIINLAPISCTQRFWKFWI